MLPIGQRRSAQYETNVQMEGLNNRVTARDQGLCYSGKFSSYFQSRPLKISMVFQWQFDSQWIYTL